MDINLDSTIVFQKNWEAKTRFIANEGSARSSKTISIAQKYILKFQQTTGKILTIARKTGPSLVSSVMRDFFDQLKLMGLYSSENHNKSEKTYVLHGNIVEFISMDDPQKKRGAKRNYLWLNEGNELIYEDFIQLNMRTTEEVTLDYNPSAEYHWIYDKVIPRLNKDGSPACTFIHSTYKDNPFLEQSLVNEIEALKDSDPEYWKIYGLGERAKSTTTIYSNWDIVPSLPDSFDELVYGVDFGFNNPSVLLEIRIKDRDVYIREKIYATKLTNSDFIRGMQEVIPAEYRRYFIKADSAEPDRIQEIAEAGFNVLAAQKGPNSIKDGIDRLKRIKLHVTADSVNTIKEIKGYKWKIDRDGHVLDETVKFMDHSMDAMRYALGLDSEEEKYEALEVVTMDEVEPEFQRVTVGDY